MNVFSAKRSPIDRGDMRAMLGALAEEPPETRARLRGLIRELRVVTVRR